MINKQVNSLSEIVSEIHDGSIIMISGFGEAGSPIELIHALIDHGSKNLTVISNNTGSGHVGLAALIEMNRVKKMICSFPRTANSTVFPELYKSGKIELELVPQGTLAERIRAGGAGIPAFYTPTSIHTPLSKGKEVRKINKREYVLEYALKADFSLIKCRKADRYGNLIYHATARNFGPIMCTAAKKTLVQTKSIVQIGDLNPETIITPGIFVNKVIEVKNPKDESKLVEKGIKYNS